MNAIKCSDSELYKACKLSQYELNLTVSNTCGNKKDSRHLT